MANYSQNFTLNPGDTLTVNVSAPATPQPVPPSPVRYSARANAGWDAYLLNPPPDMAKVRRVVEYPGWGDQFTGKFACWAYIDALAIYVTLDNGRQFPNPIVAAHPDWILKGADGKFLFLNWRDADGSLQQYAGDPRSGFAGYQAQRCRDAVVSKGYRGPWLDDVNMSQNFCDASGNPVTVMTDVQWRAAMATYTEVLRNAVPAAEVVHNAPWGQTHGLANDPYILRQIAACDFLNIEGGFGDDGIVGGNSSDWSLTNLFRYIDWVHALGRAVVCEDVKNTAGAVKDWPYSLACFHAIDNAYVGAADYFSSQNVYPPFPGTLALNVGLPAGPRAYVRDHWERWFDNGAVFVCEPGSGQINIALPTPMYDESGKLQASIPMGPKSGRIMRKSV